MTLSLVATPPPAPTQSIEPDPLDVGLHAPTTDTVIVWVASPIRRADAPLLTLRVRQQERALHVILDLSSVTRLDPTVAADLRALETHADSCGCRLHIAGAQNAAIAEPFRRLESARPSARERACRRGPRSTDCSQPRSYVGHDAVRGPSFADGERADGERAVNILTVARSEAAVPHDPGLADVTAHLVAEFGAHVDRTAINGIVREGLHDLQCSPAAADAAGRDRRAGRADAPPNGMC